MNYGLCGFLIISNIIINISSFSSSALVPAMFVFGDSLVDDGNNNYMSSIAKANYYPYGVDFSQGPTGRFCNGKTIVDALCEFMGLPYLPPYTDPYVNGTGLLGGVNYASAAAGILDESGQHLGERDSLKQQVLNFEDSLKQIRAVMGSNLSQYLAKSIVMIVIGSNDYINNYLLPSLYTTSNNYSTQDYADLLINHYTRQVLSVSPNFQTYTVKALHGVGLRKFFLAGLGPLGCIPSQRASGWGPHDRCVDEVNRMVGLFNEGLESMVQQLNADHPGAVFAYGNAYGALGDILNKPDTYGIAVVDQGCCGLGRNQGQITCLPYSVPCSDRDRYVFWDAFHPTQAVNLLMARRAFGGPTSDCYPINVQQMAQL